MVPASSQSFAHLVFLRDIARLWRSGRNLAHPDAFGVSLGLARESMKAQDIGVDIFAGIPNYLTRRY